MDRGALVWTIVEDGDRRLARVVIGPHYQGEFEVVVLCEPDDWEVVEAEARPSGDYWGEAVFVWPVEWIADAADTELPHVLEKARHVGHSEPVETRSFSVGLSIANGHGGGRLDVAPGHLVARAGPVGKRYHGVREIRHREDTVGVHQGVVFVRFDVDDGSKRGVVSVPRWAWPRVKRALVDAGFATT